MYKYGMRSRGYAPMCQPMDGLISAQDGDRKYYSYLYYDSELSDKEVSDFQLDYLGYRFKMGDLVVVKPEKVSKYLGMVDGTEYRVLSVRDDDYFVREVDTGICWSIWDDDLLPAE